LTVACGGADGVASLEIMVMSSNVRNVNFGEEGQCFGDAKVKDKCIAESGSIFYFDEDADAIINYVVSVEGKL